MRRQSKFKSKDGSKNEIELLKNQLARVLADYDNLRKRTLREKEEFEKFANLRLILKLLSVLDMLESAQKHVGDSGLAIVIKEFNDVLGEEGIERIAAGAGVAFDANIHEALESVEDGKNGEIAEVILPGWRYKDGPVIRVAKVKVFGPPTGGKKGNKNEQDSRN